MSLIFDLTLYEYNIDSQSKQLTLFPKKLNKIPVKLSPIYGNFRTGPWPEIDIHNEIRRVVEQETKLSYSGEVM